MTTSGHPQHRDALRPCCPSCDSLRVTIYKRGTGYCNVCGLAFDKPTMRQRHNRPRGKAFPPPEKPKKAGSGVIAGPRCPEEPKPLRYDMMAHARLNWR